MTSGWQPEDPSTLGDAAERILGLVGDPRRELDLAYLAVWSWSRFQESEKADGKDTSAKKWASWITGTCRLKARQALRYKAAGKVLRDEVSRGAIFRADLASESGPLYSNTPDLESLEVLSQMDPLLIAGFLEQQGNWRTLNRCRLRREMYVWWAMQPGAPDKVKKEASQIKRKKTMAGGDGCALAQAVRKIAHSGDVKRRMAALECIDSDILAHFRAACFMIGYKIEKKLAQPVLLDDLTEEVAKFLTALQMAQAEVAAKGMRNHGPDQPIHATRSDRVAVCAAGTGR